jgi:hypothetical protein
LLPSKPSGPRPLGDGKLVFLVSRTLLAREDKSVDYVTGFPALVLKGGIISKDLS